MDIQTYSDWGGRRVCVYSRSKTLQHHFGVEDGTYPTGDSVCFGYMDFKNDPTKLVTISDCLHGSYGADIRYTILDNLFILTSYNKDAV